MQDPKTAESNPNLSKGRTFFKDTLGRSKHGMFRIHNDEMRR